MGAGSTHGAGFNRRRPRARAGEAGRTGQIRQFGGFRSAAGCGGRRGGRPSATAWPSTGVSGSGGSSAATGSSAGASTCSDGCRRRQAGRRLALGRGDRVRDRIGLGRQLRIGRRWQVRRLPVGGVDDAAVRPHQDRAHAARTGFRRLHRFVHDFLAVRQDGPVHLRRDAGEIGDLLLPRDKAFLALGRQAAHRIESRGGIDRLVDRVAFLRNDLVGRRRRRDHHRLAEADDPAVAEHRPADGAKAENADRADDQRATADAATRTRRGNLLAMRMRWQDARLQRLGIEVVELREFLGDLVERLVVPLVIAAWRRPRGHATRFEVDRLHGIGDAVGGIELLELDRQRVDDVLRRRSCAGSPSPYSSHASSSVVLVGAEVGARGARRMLNMGLTVSLPEGRTGSYPRNMAMRRRQCLSAFRRARSLPVYQARLQHNRHRLYESQARSCRLRGSSGLTKRNCGCSLPRFQCPWKSLARSYR